MDISNLTYEELIAIEADIEKRKREMKKDRYRELKESVKQAVEALVNEGFGSEDAIEVDCEDCYSINMISWRSLLDYFK